MPFELMNEKQAKFFRSFVNDKYILDKQKERQARLKLAVDQYDLRKTAVQKVLSSMPTIPKSSPFFARQTDLMNRFAKIDLDMDLGRFSSLKDALTQLEKANAAFSALLTDTQGLLSDLGSGKGVDPAEAIRMKKQVAFAEIARQRSDFNTAAAPVMDQLAQALGSNPPPPKVVADFTIMLEGFLGEVRGVAETGQTPEAAARTLDGIVSRLTAAAAKHKDNLESLRGSEELTVQIEGAKVERDVRSGLAEVKRHTDQLATWAVPSAAGFANEHGVLEKRTGTLFAQKLAPDPQAAKAALAERAGLLSEVTALATRARVEVEKQKTAFADAQKAPMIELQSLERRFGAIDPKAFVSGQAKPVLDLIAATRTAVTGLNGCNKAALDAAYILIADAKAAIIAAEKVAVANAAIKRGISELESAINSHSGSSKPLAAAFTAHKTTLDGFKTEWAGLLISDAVKKLAELKTAVDADVQKETALLTRRAAIATRINGLQTDLRSLDGELATFQKSRGLPATKYGGHLVNDLAQCKTWSETKTDIVFYATIDQKLDAIAKEIGDIRAGFQATAGKTDDQIYKEAVFAQRELDKLVERAMKSGKPLDPVVIKQTKAAIDRQVQLLSMPNELVKEQQRIEAAAAQAEADKAAYLGDADTFLRTLAADRKTAPSDHPLKQYADQVDSSVDRINASIKGVKAGASVAAAVSELGFVRKQIEDLKKRGAKTDPKKLGTIAADWKTALAGFDRNRLKLLDEVKKHEAATKADGKGSAGLQKALGEVVNRLDARAFDAAASIMSDPQATPVERKGAREIALSQVRLFDELLLKDPVIRTCVANPFGVTDFIGPVYNRLRQIELNVLRGA
jgi:hypothetical protein